MKLLCRDEVKLLKTFLKMPIPNYICNYNNSSIDLMDCYEVGFTYANDLLRNKKINPNVSPWGDGQSVIFDPYYADVLSSILKSNLSKEINNYCQISLNILDVFKSHFSKE